MMKRKAIATFVVTLLVGAVTVKAQTLPYQNTALSFHERAVDLVSRLTLAEKAQQMGNMVDTEVKRDGIYLPMYQYWNEALHGVARSGNATSFPESKGMSASWDRQLIFDCATAISDEARVYNNLYNKGLNYWCPTINMSRDPRWGRDEENYGEDPFLAGQLAVQFIKGMQGNNAKYLKTVACAKHFAANNYEQGRQGSTSYMTKHILREYYLPAFEMSVKEGGVKSIMSSYNALSTDINETNAAGVKFGDAAAKGKAWGGKPNAMNDWLLNDILRHEWGFDGYVTSDCAGVSCIYRNVKHCYYGANDDGSELQEDYKARATADAIKAGNDMNCEFKNQTSIFQSAVEAAISKGYMTEADLDKALIRVLETRFALGEFDDSNPWSSLGSSDLESEANQALALKAAQESIVLLKNENVNENEKLLPLSTDKTVALIGPYANQIMLGDYSGTPTYTTTPFQAFANKLNFSINDGTVQAESFTSKSSNANGVDSQYPNELANTAPGVWFCYKDVDFGSTPCKDFIMACAAKNTGVATVNFILDNPDGEPFLSVSNVDNGNWHSMTTVTTTIDESKRPSGIHDLYVRFSGDQKYAGNYDYFRFYNEGVEPLETVGPLYMVQTSTAVNEEASADMIARAVAVAQKADVVVFCGGTDYSKLDNHATGTESHDRFVITMPGNQTALLQALYAVNKNIVLVLETNSSMDITWEKANLPAIVEAWYGGQAQGQAICDVLYGDVTPSGKLTSTWYNRLEELPSASDSQFGADGMLEYNIDDWGYTYMYYGKGTGANVSRQAATPMYPFGYGLSYTTFEYSNADINSTEARCTITNTGSRKGAEVVQVYVSFPNSSVPHMKKLNRRLVGFERVELEPGQSTQVTIPINKQQLAYWNDDTDELWVEGGTVNVYISASSADDRLTGSFNTTAEKLAEAYKGGSEEPEEPVSGISIPTASGTYMDWNEATIIGASVENNGENIGSTGANTIATFTIGNSTKQDYILTFGTAAKDLTGEIEVTMTNSKNEKVLDEVAAIENTGSWYLNGTERTHSYLISQLPVGTYTLKFATKSTTGSYAGNWGKLAFTVADAIPGTLTLSKGVYNGPKLENDATNVGYVQNGGTATYQFVNNTAGSYKMTMDLYRYDDGNLNIVVKDKDGNVEANTDYAITSANPSSYTATDITLNGEISEGFKTMTFTFTNGGGNYICNYKAPTFTIVEGQQEDPVVLTTVDIKNNEGTRENGVWTNGIYTLSTNSLDGYNQYFKMNGNDYTISLPADVVVKQLIFKECSNNYAGNDAQLVSVSSAGATCTLPEDTHFYHESEGAKHDIIVTIENHSAGNDISFNLPKKGQPMCWIQLVITKQDPSTAPLKTAELVTVVNNHAVVAVTFDREIPNAVEATINSQIVTAEGGSSTLYFPVWNLEYATNYYLDIAVGAVADAYGNSNTSAFSIAVNTSAKAAVAAAAYDYVVSSVEELTTAVEAVNSSNNSASAARKTIFIKNGDYNLGNFVGQGKSAMQLKCYNVSLIGESRDGVVIHADCDGISNPVLNLRDRTGFYLQDLTVRNDHDYGNGLFNGGVAVAVYGGDKTIMKRVRMLSNQDTQVTGHRAYIEDCDIHGTVDFICGGGDNFYYHTNLVLENRAGDVIAAPSTNTAHKWGYVFQHCTVSAMDDATNVTDGSWNLGRPWQNEPRTTYLNTTMNVLPNDNGWTNMSNLPTHFYEYNSMDSDGNTLDLSGRGNSPSSTNHYIPVLSDDEAQRFTVENVLGGNDSWLPTDYTTIVEAPAVSLSGTTLSWTAVDDARCYVIFKDGTYVANQTATSYELTGEGIYTVRAANEMGGLGEASTAITLCRSITAGKWSTIVVPFDIAASSIENIFGTGASVAELTGGTADKLNFSTTLTDSKMKANQPYAIKVASNFSAATINDVSLKENTPTQTIDDWQFVGTYDAGNIPTGSYFFSNNQLWQAADDTNTIKPFRAWFTYNGANASRELSFTIDDETTSISEELRVKGEESDGVIYDLQGRRVRSAEANSSLFTIHSSLKPGVYIVNGKRVIIK